MFQRFQSQSFERQILSLALVLDPLGFILGYALAPTLNIDPLMGGVYGLVAASFPVSLWVMHYASQQDDDG